MSLMESVEAIGKVDELLASVGLGHGSRKTLGGTWTEGERLARRLRVPSGGGPARTGSRSRIAPVQSELLARYPWLRHGFSTRAGGISAVYGDRTLNLGWTRQDAPGNVVENRRRFASAVWGKGNTGALVGIRQFHSGMIRVVEGVPGASMDPSLAAEGLPSLRGDGLLSNLPGVLVGVGVADCVPVLVADVRRKVVAAFHAGWRGTLARMVERGIGIMRLQYGSKPKDLVAVVGPSIGACCYAVGEEVRFEFESQFAYAPSLFTEVYDSDPVRERYPLLFLTARAPGHSNIGPQIHLDLWEANRRQLIDAGVAAKRIDVIGECTACTRLRGGELKYFSHRGESGFTGRMMAAIGVVSRK